MPRIGVALLTVGLAACSSGSSKPSRTPTTTASTRPASAADRLAQAGVLRQSDFSKDYRADAPTKSDDAAIRATPTCAAFPMLIDHGIATAYSRSFFSPTVLVGNKVDVFSDAQKPRAFIEQLRDPAIIGCLHDLVVASLAGSTSAAPATVDVSPIAVDEAGDDTSAFRFTFTTSTTPSTNGSPTTTVQDQVVVRVGRTILILRPTAKTAGGLAQLESRVLPVLVKRLQDAGASRTP